MRNEVSTVCLIMATRRSASRTCPLGFTAIATGITGSGIDASYEPSEATTGTDFSTDAVAAGAGVGAAGVPVVPLLPVPVGAGADPAGVPPAPLPSGRDSVGVSTGLSEPGEFAAPPLSDITAESLFPPPA